MSTLRNGSDAPAEPDPRDGWVSYSHPLGATLKHPAGWTTQAHPMGVALVPGDAQADEEVLLLWGTPLQPNAPAPSSPEAGRQLDAIIAQAMPGLSRTGEPRALETPHGPGALFTYTGNAPDGRAISANVFFTAGNNIGLGLTLLGLEDRVGERADVAELVFTSFGMKQPDTAGPTAGKTSADTDDPRLIGAYSAEAYAGGQGIHVNTQLLYVLNADGTFLSGARSYMNASKRDINGNLKWTAGQDSANNVLKGRWSAKGGYLTVVMDNGQRSVVAYGFEPDGTLATRDATTRKLIQIYSRIR